MSSETVSNNTTRNDSEETNPRYATVELTYEANCAHNLPEHEGKCRRVHGHNYKFTIGLAGYIQETPGPSQGMLIDFDAAEDTIMSKVIDELDHRIINDVIEPDSPYYPPTTENVAYWTFDKLYLAFGDLLDYVVVSETRKSSVKVTYEDFAAYAGLDESDTLTD
jgi:6-pyruvoyltetrahydropterin/6-carboxytetrahydropterin synthase